MARKATRSATKKRTTTRKATTRKTTARKSTARKTTARKTTARKTTAKKKTTARKTTARKTTPRKTTARKTTARKTTARKSTARPAARAAAAAEKPKKIRKTTKPKNTTSLSYTQSEFFEHVKGFCGLEKRAEAKELWNDLSLFIVESLRRGYRVPLVGLGKLYVRKSKARKGRNPATGETIQIPARKRVRFTAAKQLKDAVL